MSIIQVKGFTNYIKRSTIKHSIVLHGTAGGTAQGAISWLSGPAGKGVAVHCVIDQDGKIYQLIPWDCFAYHAGSNFRTISETSFSIQIVNWLNLKQVNGVWCSWTGKPIQKSRIITVTKSWRGYTHFHSITDQQHESIQYLLKYLCQNFGIRKKFFREYDPKAGFNTNQFTGILQHSSFHPTKMDFEPSVIPKISIQGKAYKNDQTQNIINLDNKVHKILGIWAHLFRSKQWKKAVKGISKRYLKIVEKLRDLILQKMNISQFQGDGLKVSVLSDNEIVLQFTILGTIYTIRDKSINGRLRGHIQNNSAKLIHDKIIKNREIMNKMENFLNTEFKNKIVNIIKQCVMRAI